MIRAVIALIFVVTLLNTASARVIDDFSVGPVAMQTVDTTAATSDQTLLDSAHVLGGKRFIQVGFGGGSAGQTATVDTTARKFNFATVGSTLGYLTVRYGSEAEPLNLDVTADGSQNFKITMTDITPGPSTFGLSLRLYGAGTSHFISLNPQVSSADDVVDILLPFSDFSVALLNDIDRIELNLIRFSQNSQFSILSIATTVPEPTTVFLAGICGLILLFKRC